jgi:hypothetical protein
MGSSRSQYVMKIFLKMNERSPSKEQKEFILEPELKTLDSNQRKQTSPPVQPEVELVGGRRPGRGIGRPRWRRDPLFAEDWRPRTRLQERRTEYILYLCSPGPE